MSDNISTDAIRYERDGDGIAILTMDDPQAGANTMNDRFSAAMTAILERLEADRDSLKGVVVTSAKKTFFAGGDLVWIRSTTDPQAAFDMVEQIKAQLRRLETLGKPVAAAINGAALGGGLELALACHHRVAVDDAKSEIGLPEVTLGLLPGGGGVTRTVRMLGLADALMKVLLEGKRFKPAQAKELGLIDELVASQEELVAAARAWVLEHAEDEGAYTKPWDRKGFKLPGGTPSTPALAVNLPAFPANLRKQLKGADYPAPKAILCAAVEGAQVDFDTASRIESRYFAKLVCDPTSKNMIQAFFFDLQAIKSGAFRPRDIPQRKAVRIGVLGAGMMGAGIAYACARSGVEVVLKDLSVENAEKGKDYSVKLLDKQVERGRMEAAQRTEILDRIKPSDDYADVASCDVIIEAVFEDAELKAKVYGELELVLGEDTLVCSNTSTLPISKLAAGVKHPQNFIGLHFFSPVDKMQLVEIITGEQTSDEALARAVDIVQQIRKIPIVVNDSRGFYTSRVFGMLLNEGASMVGEGVEPVTIERAATMAGFPAPPLAMLDEISLTLTQHIRTEAEKLAAASGQAAPVEVGAQVIDRLVNEFGRKGRAAGAGFYDYPEGSPKKLWPGLREHFRDDTEPHDDVHHTKADEDIPLRDIQDRYLFIMALETAKVLQEGVVHDAPEANIGGIFGIGFPAMTGGPAQFMTNYAGADGKRGLAGFVARADELAEHYGDRFRPTDWLRAKAESGEALTARG